ncbi:PAS/PAC domain-containing protein [Candidatus Vecturithrix granuli]|uniref:PAS/PAC domain-containing protein n=1 Tax=Vecturithrix granuli TaxID=1499967 RepID=A0A081C2P3_VECG1|nr:PAS/PAC domain-containing protein [Candidatus Vecturithrix granuli]
MAERIKPNILLVDDRPENLLVLEGVLDGEGYNLHKANSGPEALRIVLKQPFDLILLDVQMPEMDGFEVARLLRGKKESKEIPIIFITAISKEAKYVSRGFELGAENYLFKPIDPNILKEKVRNAIQYYRYKRQMKMYEEQLQAKRKERVK